MANTGYVPILTVHQNQNIELADKVTDQIDEMFRDVNVLITPVSYTHLTLPTIA
mgnify:CR=1 FL=1